MVHEKILQNIQAIFPKNLSSELVNPLERIGQRITDFIRGNPLVSTAAIGVGTTGIVATAVAAIRKRRGKRVAKRRVRRRKVSRKRVKVRHGRRVHVHKRKHIHRVKHKAHRSPRHRGHKRVSFVTAGGKRVNFLVKSKSKRRKR